MSRSGSIAGPTDRRAARRQATVDEIVAAAWELVRANGLAGLSMRDLGQRVGMKAQSLYSYFASKNEIYDAMFQEGNLAFRSAMFDAARDSDGGPVEPDDVLRAAAHGFFEFCTSDPVRYQLLFQRTIPEFVPSSESYAVALEVYGEMSTMLATVGVDDAETADLWTALLTGLSDQQISNDPGGQRWERLIDRAVDMFLRDLDPVSARRTAKGNGT